MHVYSLHMISSGTPQFDVSGGCVATVVVCCISPFQFGSLNPFLDNDCAILSMCVCVAAKIWWFINGFLFMKLDREATTSNDVQREGT